MAFNVIMLVSIKCERKECPILEKVMAFKGSGNIRAKIVTRNCLSKHNKTMIWNVVYHKKLRQMNLTKIFNVNVEKFEARLTEINKG
jgi:hypothetical protein